MIVTGPADAPVTTPPEVTVALNGVPLLHVPPGSPLDVSIIVEPMHTVVKPLIVPAFGAELAENVALMVWLAVTLVKV